MSYTVIKNESNPYNFGSKRNVNTIKYIVIHYTGNKTDTAINNGKYFHNNKVGASAHYFVDDNNVVISVSANYIAYAVGKNYGTGNLFGKCTNANSLSIECCSKDGKITDKTYANLVTLTKALMKAHNIEADHVVRHFDVCSKQCPAWKGWINSDISKWKQFKSDISPKTTSTPKTPTNTKKSYQAKFPSGTLKKGDKGSQVKLLQAFLNGTALQSQLMVILVLRQSNA